MNASIQTYKHTGRQKERHIHPSILSFLHTFVHTCMHTNMHTHKHAHMHAYIHANIHTDMHAYLHTYIHAYIHTFMHTYIHTDMQTYMHTYMHTLILTRAARVLIYHQRCCHVSHLQTYMIILRGCCTKNHTYLRCILRRCCNKYHKNLCYIRTKKVLQKSQCITKGAAKTTKQHTAKCNLLHGFSCITKGAAKVPVHYISRIAAPPPAEARFLGRKEAKDGATPLGASWSFLRKVLDLGSAT